MSKKMTEFWENWNEMVKRAQTYDERAKYHWDVTDE